MWMEDIYGPEPFTDGWYAFLKKKLANAPDGVWRHTSDSGKEMIYLYVAETCEVLAEIENKDSVSPNTRGLAIANLLVEARNSIPLLIEDNKKLRDGLKAIAIALGLPPSEATPQRLIRHVVEIRKEYSDSLSDDFPHRKSIEQSGGSSKRTPP